MGGAGRGGGGQGRLLELGGAANGAAAPLGPHVFPAKISEVWRPCVVSLPDYVKDLSAEAGRARGCVGEDTPRDRRGGGTRNRRACAEGRQVHGEEADRTEHLWGVCEITLMNPYSVYI